MITSGDATLTTILIGSGVIRNPGYLPPISQGNHKGLLGLTEFGFGMTNPFRLNFWGFTLEKNYPSGYERCLMGHRL